MDRRAFLAGTAACGLLAAPVRADALTRYAIGFQKNGVLIVARNQKLIEAALAPQNIAVDWVEFPSGPPLLEAMNAGSIDFGTTGDTPAIFAQAARADVVYVAALPSRGRNSAILVPKESPIRGLADLRGRTLAFTKGSSAHNVALAALDRAGLTYADIQPVYLAPGDATAAFARGAVAAWSIWDPFYAAAELNAGARTLARGDDLLGATNSFFLANGTFAQAHPDVVRSTIAALQAAGRWAEAHKGAVAQALSDATGVPLAVQARTAERGEFLVTPLTPAIVATQQAVADRFAALKLIPRPITVAERVWAG